MLPPPAFDASAEVCADLGRTVQANRVRPAHKIKLIRLKYSEDLVKYVNTSIDIRTISQRLSTLTVRFFRVPWRKLPYMPPPGSSRAVSRSIHSQIGSSSGDGSGMY